MKRELEHFTIGDSYGGNQDWFPTFMMHIGGCGAETACDSSVYFALHRGLETIAPENAATLSRRDYVRFAYRMKPYLSPRRTGIDRLDIYIDGYAKYLNDCGETRLSMTPFDGAKPFDAARDAIMRQIDLGCPIPTLINGYDETDTAFLVKAVTYSHYEWLDLRALWDTGYERRGGFVLYRVD